MSENPDITVVRDSYDALAAGDLARAGSLLAEDVVFHIPGRGALAGDHAGKDQVESYLEKLAEQVGDALRLEPDAFIAGESRVVALLRARGERGGRVLDELGVHVFRVTDGKISERWSFPQDTYVIDEFFA